MKPLHFSLALNIRSQNLNGFNINLNNKNCSFKTISRTFIENIKFLSFPILKALFLHENHRDSFFKENKFMIGKQEYLFAMYTHSFYDLVILLLENNKKSILKELIDYIININLNHNIEEIILYLYNNNQLELALSLYPTRTKEQYIKYSKSLYYSTEELLRSFSELEFAYIQSKIKDF